MADDTLTIKEEIKPEDKGGTLLPKLNFQQIMKHPATIPGIVVLVALIACFWPLFKMLPDLWFEGDGYYSHGVLVPLISGYMIWKWWDKLKEIPVAKNPQWLALLPMLVTAWLFYAGIRGQQMQIVSVALVGFIWMGIWFVLGGRWMWKLTIPVFYLFFMLPVWTAAIDNYTNPLQIISTEVSYAMLQIGGFDLIKEGSTTIHMNSFTLDVGVPCSGLKLVLAVTAFTFLFVAIGRLKWWGNLVMLSAILPLCLFINGLRIALIGVVGERYGADAGHQFHDYSGYITLLVCFFLLFKLARLLGWND